MAEEKGGMAKGLLIGFIAGAVAGAVTALLYAPKSGKELRTDLKQRANNLKDDASDYLKSARVKMGDTLSRTRSRSDEFVSEVKQKAEDILDDADTMLSSIRERAADESGKVKAAFRAGVDAYKSEKERPRS
jgi:gas vesicle protein